MLTRSASCPVFAIDNNRAAHVLLFSVPSFTNEQKSPFLFDMLQRENYIDDLWYSSTSLVTRYTFVCALYESKYAPLFMCVFFQVPKHGSKSSLT